MRYTKQAVVAGLGALLAGGALAASADAAVSLSCSYDPVTKRVTARFPPDPSPSATLVRFGSQIRWRDTGTGISINCAGPNSQATIFNTDGIVVQPAPGTDSGFQQLTIDQTNGAFSPGAASESGLAEIEISMRTGGGNDALNVIGTPFRDVVRVGMGVGVASAASVLDLNGDGDEDVLVSQAAHISVKGQGGDDNLSARGIPGVAGPSIRPVALHGGANNDELAVSNAVGSLNPRDLLIGDAGIDFLDLRDGGVDTGVGGADFDVARIDAGRDGVVEVESTQ